MKNKLKEHIKPLIQQRTRSNLKYGPLYSHLSKVNNLKNGEIDPQFIAEVKKEKVSEISNDLDFSIDCFKHKQMPADLK